MPSTREFLTYALNLSWGRASAPSQTSFYVGLSNGSFNAASTMADFAAAEITTAGGYARQQITYTADGVWVVGNSRPQMASSVLVFTASGGDFDTFNTIWVAIGATGTRGDSTGIARFYTTTTATNGVSSIDLTNSQDFQFTFNASSGETLV